MKKILISILVLFTIVFANGCYFVFQHQDKSMAKINQGKELNLYECCSIYTIHIVIWMFGWPLSPEAAKECFLLHFSQKDTVEFKTTKAIYSPKIAKACESLSDKPAGTSVSILWNGDKDYALNSPEHRVAIALNPCKITRIKDKNSSFNTETLYKVKIISPMIYPKYSRTVFDLKHFNVIIHEGLFRYLQDKGWLSKYIAEYNLYVTKPKV